MRRGRVGLVVAALCFALAGQALADLMFSEGALDPSLRTGRFVTADGRELEFRRQGALMLLPNGGDYQWWYGCSPTSAGMMMGYYDRNGYASLGYSNLVPGGLAESETYVGPPTGWAALANNAIASTGHVADFYGGGYGASGDDVLPPFHQFNCIADFMGTSQDSVGNSNGWTTFYYWTNGAPFTAADAWTYGVWNLDGMYGIGEYVQYAGYNYSTLYTQLADNQGLQYGFTFDQYKAEIDAGRPVLIHVEGHTMLGYGYDDTQAPLVYLYDTWTPGTPAPPGHTMQWGGFYGGFGQWGVTVLEITGGEGQQQENIPEPATLSLLAAALAAVAYRRRKR